MERASLGKRGPVISRFGLGTMSLLTSQDAKEAISLVRRALDRGVTFIDTADIYENGAVEEVLGEALLGRRDKVVLATKVGLPMHGDRTRSGGSKRWIAQAVEDSLRRLKTDYIDLYQLHRPDPATPLAETIEAFDALVRAGKIRFAGSSVFPPETIVQSQWTAERCGAAPFVSEQAPYSILVRGIEAGVLPVCREYGVGVLVWSPLNGGWLTGKYTRGAPAPQGSRAASGNPFVRADDERKLERVEALAVLARQAGLTLSQMSLAWTLEHPGVSGVLLGPRTGDQLEQLFEAEGVALAWDLLDAIDEIVAPGVTIDPRNSGWVSPGLQVAQRRRSAPAAPGAQ